jgi:predicted CxxxxCH...CXXCH cytochrome family protein
MPSRAPAVVAVLFVALAGCGEPRRVAEQAVTSCTNCHDDSTGAHRAHLQALSGGPSCTHCHPDPRAGSSSHLDGRIDVVFGALATHDGAVASRFDRTTRTCTSVYCHGAFDGGNAANAPPWRSGHGDADCGTCHDLPPANHAGVAADAAACVRCHADTIGPDGALVAGGAHMNGLPEGRHDDPWMIATSAGFHGLAARQSFQSCQGCHGVSAGGGLGAACAECHGTGGEVSCASCHAGVLADGAERSSHLAAGPASGTCRTCHEQWPKADGHYQLPADAATADAACRSCHAGTGATLAGDAPPVLVGWDAPAGDFHGARAGAGFGGTLKAPYTRGAPPLPCQACHDEHSSANAFLLASTVNGTAVPAGAVDRAGVGAEVLCGACHDGERHGPCTGCHGSDPVPAGNPCFWCHGHEGILQYTAPDAGDHSGMPGPGCAHCHSPKAPPPTELVTPALWEAPSVSGVTATTATVRWSTNEPATSYVEYGIGTAGHVAGEAGLVGRHEVTLTGLEPGATYVWRVRTADQFHNVTRTAPQTFSTPAADAVPRPDLAPVSAGTVTPNTTVVAALLWYPVTAPSDTTVEYEVQLAEDAQLTFLANSTLTRVDPTLATGNSGWIGGTPTTDGLSPARPALKFDVTLTNLPQDDCSLPVPDSTTYWFRVRARDQTGKVSDWSAPRAFSALAADPWGC